MKKILYLGFLAVALFSCKQTPSVNNSDLTPLERLKVGNERYVNAAPVHPDQTLEKMRELSKGQHPFAVVVSCSDSRVPAEILFDQGLGDIFSIRTAGNVIGDYELGSIEYAVEHLGCKLVVVLGHKSCGAVKAYMESKGEKHDDHISKIVEYLAVEQEEKSLRDSSNTDTDKAIHANVNHAVKLLSTSEPVLKEFVQSGKVQVIGAYYDLESGKVTFDAK